MTKQAKTKEKVSDKSEQEAVEPSTAESATGEARRGLEVAMEKFVAVGRTWASQGLDVGRRALDSTANTLHSTANTLAELSQKMGQEPPAKEAKPPADQAA